MTIQSFLPRLGLRPSDRALIVHADDVGMCQAAVSAFVDLVDLGRLASGSVMVPCPWFPQVAAWCRGGGALDLGVHLTLTSERDGYRWGPVAERDPASGLLDEEGYFHRLPNSFQGVADRRAVERELRAQIERALAAGIDVTHLDLHMGCLMVPDLLPLYLRLAIGYRLPALVWWPVDWPTWGFDSTQAAEATRRIGEYARAGMPVFDHVSSLPLTDAEDRSARFASLLETLPRGLSVLYLHPARDTPELRALASDWPARVADYELLRNPTTQRRLEEAGVELVTYRQLSAASRRS